MAFHGWPAEALEFYEGLEADNSKTYWAAHQEVYERDVRAPMLALLAELEPEFGAGKLFRPHRDVRFSADKSPYKTAVAASFGSSGGYLQLSAQGLAAGCGRYVLAADALDRFRQAVAGPPGERLPGIIAGIERRGIEVHPGPHRPLKTAPHGYPADHPRIELLRYKGLVAWRRWPVAAWLGTAGAKRRVVEFLRTARPLAGWLADHVDLAPAESR